MTTGTGLIVGLAALVVSPFVARALGPDGRGQLVAVQLVPQMLADLAALGMGFAIVHYGARYQSSIGAIVRWAVPTVLVGSAIMMVVGFALADVVTQGDATDASLFRWYLLICPITALTVVANESSRAVGDFARWNVVVLARGLIWPVALIVGITRPDPSVSVIVVAHLTLSAVLLGFAWLIALPRLRSHRDRPPVDRATTNRYALASMVSTIPRSANAKLDQVVMSAVVGRDNLGLYAAAVGWSGLTVPVMRGLTSIAMPHVSSAAGAQRVVRVRQLVTLGAITIVVLSAVGMVATFVLWVPLYGADFASARTAAMVLIPASLLLEFNGVLSNVLRSLDRPNLVSVLEVAVLVGSTLLLLVVLRSSEVLGPAVLSLVTYLAASALYAVFVSRELRVTMRSLVGRIDVRAALGRRTARPA